jgi:hypothetical protein
VELVFPWLLLLPWRTPRIVGGIVQILFQVSSLLCFFPSLFKLCQFSKQNYFKLVLLSAGCVDLLWQSVLPKLADGPACDNVLRRLFLGGGEQDRCWHADRRHSAALFATRDSAGPTGGGAL